MTVVVISGGRPVTSFPQQAPYPPLEWPFGGFPTIVYDIPVMSVLLFLFSVAFLIHLGLMAVNLMRRGGFIVSTLITFFCAIRIISLSLRIVSTLYGFNGYYYVAAEAFLALGVFTLVLANLAMSHSIFRAHHGSFVVLAFYMLVYFLMLFALATLITGVVQPTFTLDYYQRYVDRALRIWSWTFLAIVAVVPLPLVALSACLPRRRSQRGSLYRRFWVLVLATVLVSVETWYLAGIEWVWPTSRYLPKPAWLSRAWYYIIIYTIELIVVFLYMFGGGRNDGRAGGRPANRRNPNSAAAYAGPAGAPVVPMAAAAVPAGNRWGGTTAAQNVAPARPRKKRFGGLGKLALGAGAGGAAGMFLGRRRKRRDEEKEIEEDDIDLEPSPVRPAPRMEPADAGYPPPLPAKDVRGFDTETIPEESETEDSLYAVESIAGSESKRHSNVSAPDPIKS